MAMTAIPDDTSEHSLRRPWLQFSIRTLLILIALLSVWLAIQVYAARRQKTAVAAIRNLGGRIRYDYEPGRMDEENRRQQMELAARAGRRSPTFVNEPPGPKWLRQLIGNEYFQDVVEVDLRGDRWTGRKLTISESAMKHIALLTDLKELTLMRTDISDAALQRIGKLKNLRLLVIRDNQITDAGLVHLHSLRRLEQLNVINTAVTTEGVAKLREHLPDCVVHLEERPAEKVEHLGRTINDPKPIAEEAVQRAKRKGIEVLPFPSIGEKYEFQLTDTDGNRIDSHDLRGQVVLISFWASWCRPSLNATTKLKELYQTWHADGFEIVGINVDANREDAMNIVGKLNLPWPVICPPAGQQNRNLWFEASALNGSHVPRYLLIDRDGILRQDMTPVSLSNDGLEKSLLAFIEENTNSDSVGD